MFDGIDVENHSRARQNLDIGVTKFTLCNAGRMCTKNKNNEIIEFEFESSCPWSSPTICEHTLIALTTAN